MLRAFLEVLGAIDSISGAFQACGNDKHKNVFKFTMAKCDYRLTVAFYVRFVSAHINRSDSLVVACGPGDLKVLGSKPVANRNFFQL